jgi:KDO2-lipid IV(A) lauroyltransferase
VGAQQDRLTYLTYRALGAALAALPSPAATAAAAVVGQVMARRRGGPGELRASHLRRVLAADSPVVAPDPEVVDRWARRAFRAYARYWVEGARLATIPPGEVCGQMMVERGMEHLVAGMARGKGVVMVLPHVGSWEWGGAWLAAIGYPMTSVAERVEPPALYEWFVEQRRAMGLSIVPLGPDSAGALAKTLHSGGLVGLLCDRDIVGNGVTVEFFGEKTTFPAGPATLAMRSGATLIAAAVYSGPGRDHTAVITAPIDTSRVAGLRADVGRVTQAIATEFERLIRPAPEQWHLFQPNWPSDPGADGGAG